MSALRKIYVYPTYPKAGTVRLVVTDDIDRVPHGQEPYIFPSGSLVEVDVDVGGKKITIEIKEAPDGKKKNY